MRARVGPRAQGPTLTHGLHRDRLGGLIGPWPLPLCRSRPSVDGDAAAVVRMRPSLSSTRDAPTVSFGGSWLPGGGQPVAAAPVGYDPFSAPDVVAAAAAAVAAAQQGRAQPRNPDWDYKGVYKPAPFAGFAEPHVRHPSPPDACRHICEVDSLRVPHYMHRTASTYRRLAQPIYSPSRWSMTRTRILTGWAPAASGRGAGPGATIYSRASRK